VALSGEEIRQRLVELAARWSVYDGSERAEAQTFLNELFACYGQDRQSTGARFEEAQQGRFLDLIWPRVCIVEMKRPSEAGRLASHRAQALGYWRGAADPKHHVPAPRYVVLCAFRRFEVWEPGAYPNDPRLQFDLRELPDLADSLMFLAGREPVFSGHQEPVTRHAVGLITTLYRALGDRRAAGPDELRDFVLQAVWSMFAEDLGQLEGHLFTRLVDELIEHPERSSADDLGLLFDWLNRAGERPAGGLYRDTRYVNGGLFERPARVHLDQDELAVLRIACEANWRYVEPHIFGSLLEGALGHDAQWALGAHYTHEADIHKVIGPSIVHPWQERIENASSLAEIGQLQEQLLNYVVLDPACGSGNFLYIAYRALRRLEKRLSERDGDLRRRGGHRQANQGALSAFFPLQNIKGIEISPFAVALARVTLWMAHKLAVDELDLTEATLPLEDLSGIQAGDALRTPWPQASVIIGNPPFHGDRHLRALLGDDYVRWLSGAFDCGVKDHCVYWFRQAHDHLHDGQRAGLVGTNSISQNRARSASLNYIVERGGVIGDAISTQDWPGAANVDVSIVNWIKNPEVPPASFLLDGRQVEAIDTALTDSTIPIADVPSIPQNRRRAFQGFLPGAEFDINVDQARALLARTDVRYADVVKPYLGSRDITRSIDQTPSRFSVDFAQMPLEEAMRYPAALEILRQQAKEAREGSTSYHRNPRWWQYLWPRPDFRIAAGDIHRFIAGTRVSKRIFFVWCEADWLPSDSTNVFALDTDYAMGVLTSRIHTDWAAAKSSTLEDRIRYTPSSAFDTFPWPQAGTEKRARIGDLAQQLLGRRSLLCDEHHVGLNTLYNHLDDGAFQALRRLHDQLDLAVIDAYGWPPNLLTDQRERNRRLYELNGAITSGKQRSYIPF